MRKLKEQDNTKETDRQANRNRSKGVTGCKDICEEREREQQSKNRKRLSMCIPGRPNSRDKSATKDRYKDVTSFRDIREEIESETEKVEAERG